MTEHARTVDELPLVLTPRQIAELFPITRNMVYDELAAGRLAGVRVGERTWRVSRAAVLAYFGIPEGSA